MNLDSLRQQLTRNEALLELQQKELQRLETQADHLFSEFIILSQVNIFLASQIHQKASETKYQLESLVNQGLAYIFGDHVRIQIESTFKNNKTIFSLNIIKNGVNEGRADSFGGGLLSVIAVLLRVSAIVVTGAQRFIFLDESTNFVSAQYQPALGNFLKQICNQLDFVIVLISHQETITQSADQVYIVNGDPAQGITFTREASGTAL